jgi:hypothetical protein
MPDKMINPSPCPKPLQQCLPTKDTAVLTDSGRNHMTDFISKY